MELRDFFKEYPKVALAFSGGADSAYLLYAAKQCGAEVKAYYVNSAFQPQFEADDALRLAEELGVQLREVLADVLKTPEIVENLPDRCYFCKREIFSAIFAAAEEDGYSVVIDGTNASDDAAGRPGMQALREMGVRSPLRECGITKDRLRELSREAGLFTWDKPAYACLATRIPCGQKITRAALQKIELAEDYLRELGFRDFRIRMMGNSAKIQVRSAQLGMLLRQREEILGTLKMYYAQVLLDLEVRDEI